MLILKAWRLIFTLVNTGIAKRTLAIHKMKIGWWWSVLVKVT